MSFFSSTPELPLEKPRRNVAVVVLLGIIILGAFFVRVWGIDFGLPCMYHPDEPNKVKIAQKMFRTGDLNPHYFNKPTLFIYLNALLYIPYYLFGKVTGRFDAPSDILQPVMLVQGTGYSPMPETVLMARVLTAVVATATIPVVFLVAKRLTGSPAAGLFASSLMAVFPTNVLHSRFITVNSFLVFFIVLTVLFSLRILSHGTRRDYIMAGVFTGLAVSSKYPGALIGIVPLAAHFLRTESFNLKDREIRTVIYASAAAFLLTTPFALLKIDRFLKDTFFEARHYSTGHAGMEGNAFGWYLGYMWKNGVLLPVLALLEIVRGLLKRSKPVMLLSVFPVLYFLFISSFVVRNDRTFLPLTPFLFLLAASFLVSLVVYAGRLQPKTAGRRGLLILAAVLSVSVLIRPVSLTIAKTLEKQEINSRETARIWIDGNLPPGSRIAVESYSPFVDPERFSVKGILKMIQHPPEWYVENNFEYLVFSQGMYMRFYRQPQRYSEQVAAYDSFFNRFEEIKRFRDGGYEVRVYKVGR